ncbi:MAG TPA: hypothetical protein VL133_16975 [Devosia sp.]|nr:hypothetical protein [Devosia sp.]
MFTRISLLQKVPGMSREHFNSFWRLVHGPGALFLNSLLYYHQNVVNQVAGTAEPVLPLLPLDGIAQLGWADKYQMYDAFYKSSRRRNVADVQVERQHFLAWQKTFLCQREDIDTSRIVPEGAQKAFVFLGRNLTVSPAQFNEKWTQARQELLSSAGVVNSVRSVVVERLPMMDRSGPYEEMPYDEVEEIWFEDAEALQSALGDPKKIRDGHSSILQDIAVVNVSVTRFVA